MAEIFKEFTFDSAHRLPYLPEGHKCARLHGHTYHLAVHVAGPADARLGWLMDFADIEKAFAPIEGELDHRYLNEIPGLENPTSEILVRWIWRRLKPALPQLSELVLRETCTAGCVYRGEEE